jgi:hypothetical protein
MIFFTDKGSTYKGSLSPKVVGIKYKAPLFGVSLDATIL